MITSNLLEISENDFDYVFSFNDCVYFNEVFCEDSTLMLLNVLEKCGCQDIYLAGFDGFSNKKSNYFSDDYTKEDGNNVTKEEVKYIINSALGKLRLHFLTPSMYQNDFE